MVKISSVKLVQTRLTLSAINQFSVEKPNIFFDYQIIIRHTCTTDNCSHFFPVLLFVHLYKQIISMEEKALKG